MKRIFSAIIFVILAFIFAGCESARKDGDSPKISELIKPPKKDQKRIVSADFHVYFFELAAAEYNLIAESLAEPNDPDMQLTIPDVFTDNGFAVTGGQRSYWTELGPKLHLTQAKKTQAMVLMLNEGIGDDLAINTLKKARQVFCKISDNKFLHLKLGPGQAALRIKISQVIGLLGVCRVDVTPIFIAGQVDEDGIFARKRFIKDTVFDGSTVNFRIRPGQFVLFGPKSYEPEYKMLGSTFFTTHKTPPAIKLVLLACNLIRE